MIWKTTNYKGEEVTWYSEEEVGKILRLAQIGFFNWLKEKESLNDNTKSNSN